MSLATFHNSELGTRNSELETPRPEEYAYRVAARLLAVQHAVAEIAGGRKVDADPQALRDAVLQLRNAVKAVDGAYATIVGGLAVQHLGYERWTDDVDVVVDAEHYGEVLDRLRAAGFVLTADFTLQNTQSGAKLDLLKEGAMLKNSKSPLPHPRELGPNCGFATIAAIIRLKLEAHRRQDLADIVALLKTRLGELDRIRATLPDAYRERMMELGEEARREIGN